MDSDDSPSVGSTSAIGNVVEVPFASHVPKPLSFAFIIRKLSYQNKMSEQTQHMQFRKTFFLLRATCVPVNQLYKPNILGMS